MAQRGVPWFWYIVYAIPVILVILAFLPVFGVPVSPTVLAFFYIVIIALQVLSIIHWARLI